MVADTMEQCYDVCLSSFFPDTSLTTNEHVATGKSGKEYTELLPLLKTDFHCVRARVGLLL